MGFLRSAIACREKGILVPAVFLLNIFSAIFCDMFFYSCRLTLLTKLLTTVTVVVSLMLRPRVGRFLPYPLIFCNYCYNAPW